MKSSLLFSNVIDKDVFISFVIPTYKRTKYLDEAIRSVLSLEGLKDIPYELLVINNDPSDRMEEVIEKYREYSISIYVNQENYGMIGNVNQGAILAKGRYISFLHDDDFLLSSYLNEISLMLDKNYDCIIPGRYLLSENKINDKKQIGLNYIFLYRFLYRKKYGLIKSRDYLYSSKNIYLAPTCGTLFKKQSLCNFGYFKDESGYAWDYYNFRKFNEKYKVGVIRRYISVYRLSSGISNNNQTRLDFYEDQRKIIEENENKSKFIKCFSKEINYQYSKLVDGLIVEKPNRMKYLFYLIFTNVYFYTRNLDISNYINKEQLDVHR